MLKKTLKASIPESLIQYLERAARRKMKTLDEHLRDLVFSVWENDRNEISAFQSYLASIDIGEDLNGAAYTDPRIGQSVTMPWAQDGAPPPTPAAGPGHTGPLDGWGPEPDARGNFPVVAPPDDADKDEEKPIPWAHEEGVRMLRLWVERGNAGRPMTAKQLFPAIKALADQHNTVVWRSSQEMAGWFAHNMAELRRVLQVATERQKNIKVYKFFPKLQAVR